VGAIENLRDVIGNLTEEQAAILLEVATALHGDAVVAVPSEGSDIATGAFVRDFGNRLLVHHATSEELLNKKSFEFAFVASSRAAGRVAARIASTEDNPHADVVVDEVMYSLKTESAASIRLMEARWIRECRNRADLVRGIQSKVVPHLESYQRIIILRVFSKTEGHVQYDLVEIPRDVLLEVRNLGASDFSALNDNNSSRADIKRNRRALFALRLDGSVEKVTIANLRVDACTVHATWTVKLRT
jgi:hypothetical protein